MKSLATLAIIALLITACAGRSPRPVIVTQYGDPYKSCDLLALEFELIKKEVRRLLPESDTFTYNASMGVAGLFYFYPWFFLNLTEAEQREIEALHHRYNHLINIAKKKECGFSYKPAPVLKREIEDPTVTHTYPGKPRKL